MNLLWKVDGNWLRVWKEDGTDGIKWDDLQTVKNDAFGKEARAIEIYPPESELINLKNMRHLWLLPDDVALPNLRQVLLDHGFIKMA